MSLRVSFFVAAAVLLLAVPLATLAQQPQRIPRIGFLSLQSLKTDSRLPAFIAGMRERGYVEGQTITIEWRSADGDATRLAAYAEELVRLKVELIVAAQPQAIEAARRVTGTIPIVFAVAQDPVASGFRGYGFKAVISKPFTLQELRSTIDSVIVTPRSCTIH